jgi:hypothetical protein
MLLLPGCLAWPRSAAGGAWAVWTGRSGSRETSCAIRGARGGDIGHRSPPGSSEELGWAGCGPGGPTCGPGGPACGPLGSVAGDPDRHRGWLLCPSSVPAAAGRGLRPRMFSAHGPGPQLQVQDSVVVMGGRRAAAPRCWHCVYRISSIQTGPAFLLQAIFMIWPDLVPIQTGAPAQIRAADRPSSTPAAVLPGGYMICGLGRPHGAFAATCEVLRDHTARAHASTAVLSDCLRFCMCGFVLCGSSAGQSRKKNGLPHPGPESHVAVCMPAARKEAI